MDGLRGARKAGGFRAGFPGGRVPGPRRRPAGRPHRRSFPRSSQAPPGDGIGPSPGDHRAMPGECGPRAPCAALRPLRTTAARLRRMSPEDGTGAAVATAGAMSCRLRGMRPARPLPRPLPRLAQAQAAAGAPPGTPVSGGAAGPARRPPRPPPGTFHPEGSGGWPGPWPGHRCPDGGRNTDRGAACRRADPPEHLSGNGLRPPRATCGTGPAR